MPPYIIKLSILCINLLSLIFAVFILCRRHCVRNSEVTNTSRHGPCSYKSRIRKEGQTVVWVIHRGEGRVLGFWEHHLEDATEWNALYRSQGQYSYFTL